MAEVDVLELEKEASKKKASINRIETKLIGEKQVYKGPFIDKWFDDRDECAQANEDFARKKSYKDQGLNENGQTEAQVLLHEARLSLLKDKEKLLSEARKIDVKIGALKVEDFEVKKASKKK